MKFAKWNRKKSLLDAEPEEMKLQLTSMVDIFAIILVFLLKSLTSGLSTLAPHDPASVPYVSGNESNLKNEALSLEVGESYVSVDHGEITKLEGFRFQDESAFIHSITESLLRVRVKNLKRHPASASSVVPADSRIQIFANEQTPYSTLKPILTAAAVAGYVDLQLVVSRTEGKRK